MLGLADGDFTLFDNENGVGFIAFSIEALASEELEWSLIVEEYAQGTMVPLSEQGSA